MLTPPPPPRSRGGQRPPRSPLIDAHAVPVVNFPIQHFGKEIFHHSHGNKLHKVQESAASAVGDKLQARGERSVYIPFFPFSFSNLRTKNG